MSRFVAPAFPAPDSVITAEGVMRRVISDLQTYDYHNRSFYHYTTYEKRDLTLNDIDPLNVQQRFVRKRKWVRRFIERNDLDNKFSLPLMTDERVEENYWRRHPKREVTVVTGVRREGINTIFTTSDILQVLMGEKYSDINIFDNKIKLDYPSIHSPIGRDAPDHYAYELLNMAAHETDTVYHVMYKGKDPSEITLTGEILIVRDSLPHIKYVSIMLPHKKQLKSVEKLYVTQEFNKSLLGDWVMTSNDVMTELRPWGNWGRLRYVKSQRFSAFSADSIAKSILRGGNTVRYDPKAEYREDSFWNQYDGDASNDSIVPDSNSALLPSDPYAVRGARVRINEILDYAEEVPGMRFPIWLLRSYVNNYIETGSPSKFVIQPTRALISFNDLDGLRLRFGGTTTAQFNRRVFLDGYVAYGFKQHKTYYRTRATYSFNDKKYQASEYPRRNIIFESRHDICNIAGRSEKPDNDDLFRSLRWRTDRNRMFYKQQKIEFERDEKFGLYYKLGLSHERDEATGNLTFGTLSTSELQLAMEYSPSKGYYYIANTQVPVNSDAPTIGITHKWGIKGLLGGEYDFHLTEMKIYKRFFLGNWGFGKATLKMGAVWNRVPYPLLLSPAANMSYIIDEESFSLINPSEFVNDRYSQLMLSWETNGNFLGVISWLKRARMKEYFGLRVLYGDLTDKNNPTLPQNADSGIHMPLPEGFYIMHKNKPYIEGVIGIHNIFQIINIDYIHRFSYRNLPNSRHSGVRFSLHWVF